MPRMAFYVDSHGFGHATRAMALAEKFPPDWTILFRTNVPAWLFNESSLKDFDILPSPLDLHPQHAAGYRIDPDATIRHVGETLVRSTALIEDEVSWLRRNDIDLVLSDISPLAIESAHMAAIPGYGVSNFTWHWILEPLLVSSKGKGMHKTLERMISHATMNFRLPFSTREVFPDGGISTPLLVRHHRHTREETRNQFGLLPDQKYVLLTFGGFDHDRTWEPLLDFKPLQFIRVLNQDRNTRISLTQDARISNLWYLSSPNFYHPDLVQAVDAVITKPGYGICSECMHSGTPLLLDSRSDFREFQAIKNELESFPQVAFLDNQSFSLFHWGPALDRIMSCQPLNWHDKGNGADFIVAAILNNKLPNPIN